MSLSTEDRGTIAELIALHGHLTDEGKLDQLDYVFTSDVVYDLSDFGLGSLHGIEAIGNAARAMGDANPVGHHVTNIVLVEIGPERVLAHSKGIGVNRDGTTGSVVYEDQVTRQGKEWRISHRKVVARRIPLRA